MSFEYESLSPRDMLAIAEQRLHQFESEHYTNKLVRSSLEAATDLDAQQRQELIAEVDQKLATLERAISMHRAEKQRLLDLAPDTQAVDGAP